MYVLLTCYMLYHIVKEELTLFHNPAVLHGSESIQQVWWILFFNSLQPPLFLMLWKLFDIATCERVLLPLLECIGFASFFYLDLSLSAKTSKKADLFPLSTLV